MARLESKTVFPKTNITNPNLSGLRRKEVKGKSCVGENLSLFGITQHELGVSFESLIISFRESPD